MAKTPFGADRGTATLKIEPREIVIITDPDHPRYDPRVEKPLSDEFLASLKGGQLEPGIVFRNEDGRCEILNGRRRLRGYLALNESLPAGAERYMFTAVYRTVKDDAEAISIRLQANLHEGDTISAKAETAARLISKFGWPETRVAMCLGITAATVKKYVAILECAAPVVAALDAGRIGIGAALKLAELPKREQAAKLDEVTEGRAPREKGKPAKSKAGPTKHGRPSMTTIRQVAAFARTTSMFTDELALLGWVLGETTDEALVERWPELASALDVKAKAA